MTTKRLLADFESVERFAERLSQYPDVTRFNQDDRNAASEIALAFSDIEKSFHSFVDVQLPRLIKGDVEASEAYDLLLDIGEEFRTILYEITAPRFYDYLKDESTTEVNK